MPDSTSKRRAAQLTLIGLVAACASVPPQPGASDLGPCGARPDAETVVLLHGLGRTRYSMAGLGRSLERAGFQVLNVGYPSRSQDLPALVDHLEEELAEAGLDPDARRQTPVHFVSHSAGGILTRAFLAERPDYPVGRVVQLAPPNQGSSLAAALEDRAWFGTAVGPLGKSMAELSLASPHYPLGVIAGDHSIFPTSLLVEGEDDGIVAVAETRVDGMADHLVVPRTHTFIMNSRTVQRQVAHFLHRGRFAHAGEPDR